MYIAWVNESAILFKLLLGMLHLLHVMFPTCTHLTCFEWASESQGLTEKHYYCFLEYQNIKKNHYKENICIHQGRHDLTMVHYHDYIV